MRTPPPRSAPAPPGARPPASVRSRRHGADSWNGSSSLMNARRGRVAERLPLDGPRPLAAEQRPEVGGLAPEAGGPRLRVQLPLVGRGGVAVQPAERPGKRRGLERDEQL